MVDLIDGYGSLILKALGVSYGGQEPQDKDTIPTSGFVIVERLGGSMTAQARSDRPWVQFTVLHQSKKKAFDLVRDIRRLVAEPRSSVGDLFVYGTREALGVEEASLTSDPFYRVRFTLEVHVKGLA